MARKRFAGTNMYFKILKLSTIRFIAGFWISILIRFNCNGSPESMWYTKYNSYPPYCAIPQEMETRKIPEVVDVEGIGSTQLLHATVIIRHGARTPYSSNINCWEEYSANPETSKWDCNLTTFLAVPPQENIQQHDNGVDNVAAGSSMFLFEKRYDSLHIPQSNLRNDLGGTCQLAQLLLQGYEQQLTNGKHLRDAYVVANKDHNPRMKLLDLSKNGVNDTYIWNSLYYRVDDDQRTLMSGQVLIRGMFETELQQYMQKKKLYPVIPLHTADRHRDILDPNESICPRLVEIREQVLKSPAYQAFNTSLEAQKIRSFQKEVLKIPDQTRDMDAIDCLMTTICTDRPLPKEVDDYKGSNISNSTISPYEPVNELDQKYGKDRFQQLIDFNVASYSQISTANDGEFSKLGMAPLWGEIMDVMEPFVNGTGQIPLSLFSGHDSTLLPILVSLGSRVWDGMHPPYASMIIIEIHSMNDDRNKTIFPSNYTFRLIYNGKVITNRIDKCHPDMELCDTNVLLARVKSFASSSMYNMNCSLQQQQQLKSNPIEDIIIKEAESFLSTAGGITVSIVVVICGCCIGSICTYLYMSRFRLRHNSIRSGYGSCNDFIIDDGGILKQPNQHSLEYVDEEDTDRNGSSIL